MGYAPGERCYHTFYQLAAGASDEERELYGLQNLNKFEWLYQGVPKTEEDLRNDAQDYQVWRSASRVPESEEREREREREFITATAISFRGPGERPVVLGLLMFDGQFP